MRKTVLYVAAWFAAGVGAVFLASASVALVGNQVTGDRPGPLSADDVRAELAQDTTTTTAPAAVATTSPIGATSTTAGPSGSGTTPSGGSTPTTRAAPGTGGAPPTTAPTAPAETRSYSLVGGTVTLQFSASGVKVVAASPNPGFQTHVQGTHDSGVRVEFENGDHRSRVEGWWDGGAQDKVEDD